MFYEYERWDFNMEIYIVFPKGVGIFHSKILHNYQLLENIHSNNYEARFYHLKKTVPYNVQMANYQPLLIRTLGGGVNEKSTQR